MSPDRNDKKGKKGIRRILNAFCYSKDGLKAAWKDESAFRQVSMLALACFAVACFVSSSVGEFVMLMTPCVLSVLVELVNTAIENAVDFTDTRIHPLAKKAKDAGSAAQLVALAFWLIVWGGFVYSRFF